MIISYPKYECIKKPMAKTGFEIIAIVERTIICNRWKLTRAFPLTNGYPRIIVIIEGETHNQLT